MRAVGVVRDEGRHLMKCWACNYRWAERWHLQRVRHALVAYEAAVERVEELITTRAAFAVVDVVKGPDGWYTTWRAAGLAVHDMARHGLLTCAKTRPAGDGRAPACLLWRAATLKSPTPERTIR